MKETKDWFINEVEHINATVNTFTLNIQKNEILQNKHKNNTGKDTKPKPTKSTEQNLNLNPHRIQPVK